MIDVCINLSLFQRIDHRRRRSLHCCHLSETWCILIRKILQKMIFRKRKMNCDKCKNKHWRECCNDCKELEYCCYICKDIVKVKDYIKLWGTIMPIQINI